MSGLTEIQRQRITDAVVAQLRDIPDDLLPSINLGSMILDAFVLHVPQTQYHPMELVLVRALFDVRDRVAQGLQESRKRISLADVEEYLDSMRRNEDTDE